MFRFLLLAARNLRRNTRRTVISMATVFAGVCAIVGMQGFADGFTDLIIEDTVRGKVGAIQVHKRGWHDTERNRLEFDLPMGGALPARLRAVPGVLAVTPRISFDGMLNNGKVSTMFQATAIDAAQEYVVCPKRRTDVAKGTKPLEVGVRDEALLGGALAESLDARQGSNLSILATNKAGASNALDLTVRGLLPSRFIIESKRVITVPLPFAQDLLGMEGRVTEYILAVADADMSKEVAARVRAAVGPGYEIETWQEIAPAQREIVGRTRLVLGSITAILFLLVATGIANTMLMSVYERVREIGTMMAVGTRRGQVVVLFLAEAGLLGLCGALAGALLGAAIVLAMGHSGVVANSPGSDPMVIHPVSSLAFVARTMGLAVAATVLAGLLAAWKAAHRRPVDAWRSN